jgi:hypothetical protein
VAGTHAALLQKGGYYKQLYQVQAEAYSPGLPIIDVSLETEFPR